ncbi:MFS transporter [Spiractinospora alimapuensis]|uniref:MFS transporter n=1 Tax=Spiractinospora alimapuensis TaxID=2820884 RepID=UPI001F207BCC|nr:MFS transporter [Spiractinospora alimapuensis]QVQ54333.1 MFS transporter [Spiractinospora alimapuensis]
MRNSRSPWYIAIVIAAFCTLIGAAGFRSAPGVLMNPLHEEFGWSHGTIGGAVSVNLILYGLFSPFAAALMERFGVRRVVATALLLVAVGSGLTVFMQQAWHLWLLWGVVIGAATGSMAMSFVSIIVGRWFVARRGLVSGVLTAAGATGQLVFLPLIAALAGSYGWRTPALAIGLAALLTIPVVLLMLRDYPKDVGLLPYGAPKDDPSVQEPTRRPGSAVLATFTTLGQAARTRTFWLLAISFAICGASTNGLIGTHFVPAAHDHGMPATTAAGLLALIGVFDILGTVFSGWLTDRFDPRLLLVAYYTLRGGSLLLLPALLGPEVHPPMWAFILFYGLDWVATVPPTIALCANRFGQSAPVVFGWVFASHQVGAAIAAGGAGYLRDTTGSYDAAWTIAAALCGVGAVLSFLIAKPLVLAAQHRADQERAENEEERPEPLRTG